MSEENEIQQEALIEATQKLIAYCQKENMTELLAYMAMISITNTMEEELGFGYERKTNG